MYQRQGRRCAPESRWGSPASRPEALRDVLSWVKALLLVLDNCEHLAEAVATLLGGSLLVRRAHRTIIATRAKKPSGSKVGTSIVFTPLEVPAAGQNEAERILNSSAVELFITRIKASDSAYSPRAGDLPSIGAICRHLDGIPLAIEFAAAHASTFGLHRVAVGLDDRFALLTRGRRTALPRHRTLRGVLDWSYDLLSPAEQRLLRHLAVFTGGFTLEAAAALVSDGLADLSSVMEGIANLVAKSLVALDRDVASRWYLLETIRAYAATKLDEHGERDAAVRRHAAYFRDLFPWSWLASSSAVSTDDRASRIREIDNVRAALDWCFSAGGDRALGLNLTAGYARWSRVDVGIPMLDVTDAARQPLNLLSRALDTAEAVDDLDAQARALIGLITHHSFSAEHDRTLAAARRLLLVTDQMGDVALSRVAGRLMGNALVMLGRPREAQGFLESYLNAYRSTNDQREVVRIACRASRSGACVSLACTLAQGLYRPGEAGGAGESRRLAGSGCFVPSLPCAVLRSMSYHAHHGRFRGRRGKHRAPD